MKIKLKKDNYTVKIKLDYFTLGIGDLECAIDEIISNHWNWINFFPSGRLWYEDGSNFITCESVDHAKGIITFV